MNVTHLDKKKICAQQNCHTQILRYSIRERHRFDLNDEFASGKILFTKV